MASFGQHLHATKNNKLAKYTESVNFAYLSKPTPRGFDLLKVRTKKTFGKIGTISAKRTPRGFDLLKVRTKKTFGKKRKQSQKRRGASTFSKGPNPK